MAVNSTAVASALGSMETGLFSGGCVTGAWPAGMLQEARREKRTRVESKTLVRMDVLLFDLKLDNL
jgi:hypothetical protein